MYETKDARTDKNARPAHASSSKPRYSFATWTGAAYAENRSVFIAIGAAAVLTGSIAVALWLTR